MEREEGGVQRRRKILCTRNTCGLQDLGRHMHPAPIIRRKARPFVLSLSRNANCTHEISHRTRTSCFVTKCTTSSHISQAFLYLYNINIVIHYHIFVFVYL